MNDFKTRKPQEDSGGWALTLADMMTLLLCFFVLMLAMSSIDTQKYQQVSENLAETMGGKQAGQSRPDSHTVKFDVEPEKVNLFELQLRLAKLVGKESQAVILSLRPDSVAIDLKGGFFFPSGQATLTTKARSILDKIGPTLASTGYDITVEGHTDDIPISSRQFPSNWELSSARASSVARYLIGLGMPKTRLKVMGLADTSPILPNRDKDGTPIAYNQSRNRRVSIVVRPPLIKK